MAKVVWKSVKERKAAQERKTNAQKIIEINAEAKRLGMSYGKYVAMMQMKREQDEREC